MPEYKVVELVKRLVGQKHPRSRLMWAERSSDVETWAKRSWGHENVDICRSQALDAMARKSPEEEIMREESREASVE